MGAPHVPQVSLYTFKDRINPVEPLVYLGKPLVYLGKPLVYLGKPLVYLGKPLVYLGKPLISLGSEARKLTFQPIKPGCCLGSEVGKPRG
jgi:hypothetical protein